MKHEAEDAETIDPPRVASEAITKNKSFRASLDSLNLSTLLECSSSTHIWCPNMTDGARPEFVVFYAWQSDRASSGTRYFIQEALAAAAEQINSDPDASYRVRIDQDTQGVPGLCDIPATILAKIDACDGFVCDLTYIATTEAERVGDDEFKPRFCSNPNVLFELGYAFQLLGDRRMICVMNRHYGPAAEQIFDLAHRRFPITYAWPNTDASKKTVKAELVKQLVAAIQLLFPLGRRSELSANEIQATRNKFEAAVRSGAFNGLTRQAAALAISIVTAGGVRYPSQKLREQKIQPIRQYGWRPVIRGNSVLAVDNENGECCGVAELRNDGTILAADTWVLDPKFHPRQNHATQIPPLVLESRIILSVENYLETLRSLKAPLPWHVSISLLEVKGYWMLLSQVDTTAPFPDANICVEPLIVRNVAEIDTSEKVRAFLRPAIDFIWREFGAEGSPHFTPTGIYTERLLR